MHRTGEIGRVVGVHGFFVRVELDSSHRSPVRAGPDGVETQVTINAFVTFEIGAGESVLGIVTDLDAREVFDPANNNLTLELVRPRRVASVQLLGTIQTGTSGKDCRFDPGVNVLPTLDTPAIAARRDVLAAVLTDSPRRNLPASTDRTGTEEFRGEYDGKLYLGRATAATEREVHGSFNDLLSRPLAVVGNTGSGKSCSIAHFIQSAISIAPDVRRPRFFVLDVNGEYSRAFGSKDPADGRQPNRLYVNGQEFSVPIWLMNAYEACVWLNAAEQTQQPALVNLWAIAKGGASSAGRHVALQGAQNLMLTMLSILSEASGRKKGWACRQCWEAMKGFIPHVLAEVPTAVEVLDEILEVQEDDWESADRSFGSDQPRLRDALTTIEDKIESMISPASIGIEQTADKPVPFPPSKLDNPKYLEAAAELAPGDRSMRQFLQGLQLRMQNRRNDKRWHAFYNYSKDGTDIPDVQTWFQRLGIGDANAIPITVLDCSMISHEVLPYVCGIVGRMLLELREHAPAAERYREPWVVVLEEAHNYVRPIRQDEPRGIKVSRETFERVAKEGRKFGLSLVVASQRPSEISQTVLSQCANFMLHRLQNPDDIEHFRKIVPSQSRRLLDQITVLRAGEAIAVGSAFHVPTRVQVELADPAPASRSSTPFWSWKKEDERFNYKAALEHWVGVEQPELQPADQTSDSDEKVTAASSTSEAAAP